jgi:type VI protein secretion system component VasK
MNLWDFFWSMLIIFFFVMALMIWFSCLMDTFRREDIGGGMKAFWLIFMIIVPFLGCIIYMIARPKVTAQDVRQLAQAEAANAAASQVSTADELAKLTQLKDSGAITVPEYEKLKAKLLA